MECDRRPSLNPTTETLPPKLPRAPGRFRFGSVIVVGTIVVGCPSPSTLTSEHRDEVEGIAPPGVPNGPTESTSRRTTFSWEPSATSGVTYEVQTRREEDEFWTADPVGEQTSFEVEFRRDGRFEVRVRACLGAACSGFAGPVGITISSTFPSYLDSTCPGAITDPVPDQENVGAIEGQSGATAGRAVYSIEIVVPPGRRGMQPSVGLSYSSSGGAGAVGYGWSLGAASRIARCARSSRLVSGHRDPRVVGEKRARAQIRSPARNRRSGRESVRLRKRAGG